jgi:hypothetical protein
MILPKNIVGTKTYARDGGQVFQAMRGVKFEYFAEDYTVYAYDNQQVFYSLTKR